MRQSGGFHNVDSKRLPDFCQRLSNAAIQWPLPGRALQLRKSPWPLLVLDIVSDAFSGYDAQAIERRHLPPAQAVTLGRCCGWWQCWQSDIIIPDMGIRTSIGHLMNPCHRPRHAWPRHWISRIVSVLIKFRHAWFLLPVVPAVGLD